MPLSQSRTPSEARLARALGLQELEGKVMLQLFQLCLCGQAKSTLLCRLLFGTLCPESLDRVGQLLLQWLREPSEAAER